MNIALPSSLRTRLIALTLIASLPAFGTIVYLAQAQRKNDGERARARVLSVVRTVAAEHQSRIDAARQLLVALAQIPTVQDAADPRCDGVLASVQRASPTYYANLVAIRPNGEVACSAAAMPARLGHDARAEPAFVRAVASGGFAFGPYQRIADRATMTIAYPARDAANGLRVVTIAALDLSWFNADVAHARLPDEAELVAFDPDGLLLVRLPDPGPWVGRESDARPLVQAFRAGAAAGTM